VNAGVSAEKSRLREEGLDRRRALSLEDWKQRSKPILARLADLKPVQSAPLILAYAASKDNEVNTLPLIDDLAQHGRRVALPSLAPKRTMVWRTVSGVDDLILGRFGILEPGTHCRTVDVMQQEAVVLVPGICFSPIGQRIGYGGGYFDRFLSEFPGMAIGLAFDFQVRPSLPEEPHDVRVDFIVCETTAYDCREKGSLQSDGSDRSD